MDLSAANLNDHRLLEDMVDGIPGIRQPVGRPRKRPGKLHGDKGYDYPDCRETLRQRNIIARIARRLEAFPDAAAATAARGATTHPGSTSPRHPHPVNE